MDSTSRAIFDRIKTLLGNAELDEASSLALDLYENHDHSLDSLHLLVKVLYKQGRKKEAEARLKEANLLEVESHTFFDNLRPDSVVLDLGGWEGNFTAYVYDRYACEIHIVEPNPKFYEREKRRFKGIPRVHPHNCAISGETRLARFYPSPVDYPGNEKGSSLRANSPYVNPDVHCDVQQYSLSDFVRNAKIRHIDLVKMDIEGAEIDVFRDPDVHAVLNICRSLSIEFHYHMPILDKPFMERSAVEATIQRLKDQGFKFTDFGRDIEFIDCLFHR